jgi:hypothetical protein
MSRELNSYAYVNVPFDVASRLLAENAQAVLQQATDDSAAEADTLSRTLRVAVGGFEVSKDVEVEVGEFRPAQITGSVVPIRWRAETGRLLFPTLTAELWIRAVSFDPPVTQLLVTGSYDPPMGVVGAGADWLLLHRLAESTIHRFTSEVAAQLRRLIEELPEDQRL